MGGGKLKIKDHLSPAEAEIWTELGNIIGYFSVSLSNTFQPTWNVEDYNNFQIRYFDIFVLKEFVAEKRGN